MSAEEAPEAQEPSSSEDRVARAMEAIMKLREDAEAVAHAHGMSEVDSPPTPAEEPATDEREKPPDVTAVPTAVGALLTADFEVPHFDTRAGSEPVPASASLALVSEDDPTEAGPGHAEQLADIDADAMSGLKSLATRRFRSTTAVLDAWHSETESAVAEWRARAGQEIEELAGGVEQSLADARVSLEAALARLSDLAR